MKWGSGEKHTDVKIYQVESAKMVENQRSKVLGFESREREEKEVEF